MKRVLLLLVITIMLATASLVSADTSVPKKIRIAAFNFYPTLFQAKDGTVQGFYVDFLSEIAKREGWTIEYVYGNWADGLSRIKSGEVDVLTNVALTAERTQYMDYGKVPLLTVWAELYAPNGSPIDSIRDVQNKKIALMKGDFNAANFKNLVEKFGIPCTYVEYGNFEEVFKAISTRLVDAGIVNNTFGMAKQSDYDLKSTGVIFNPFDIFFTVAKGKNSDILATLDHYLEEWRKKESSPYHQARQRWSHKSASTIRVMDPWLKKTAVVSGILLCVAIGFVILLRIQVRRKTTEIQKYTDELQAANRQLEEEIEEHRRAETELIANTEDLKEAQRIAHVGTWRLDVASNKVIWSEELYRMYGFDPKLPPPPYTEHQKLFTPESWKKLSAALQNTQNTGTPYDLELETLRVDGSPGWMWVYGMTVLDASGITVGLRGMAQDITERKRIEEVQSYLLHISSLRTSEDFFELLARFLANILGMDYVCIDTLHGDSYTARTLAIYNDGKFEDNVEYALKDTPCGDVVGKEVCVFPREVRKLFPQDAALQDLQAESYVGTTLWSYDMKPIGLIAVIGRKELNSSHFAETVLKLVSIRAAGELERRKAEEQKLLLEQQFQQTQKLESLGVLAGGIAHDFNNILAIIMGNCSLAKIDNENSGNYIPEIEKASERAAALCRQMLAYAGKAELTKTKVNMRVVVDEMVTMLKSTLPQNSVIKTDLSTSLPAIEADASQLRQVVMNLIINASEAIGVEHGEIKVLLSNETVIDGHKENDYHGKPIPPGKYVCLEVTDTGCGMDEDAKRRIFEPFYTTKFTGRGLGMSAVLGIINSHIGALQLFSQPGQGTTFKVYLPISTSDTAGDEDKVQPPPAVPWQGSGIILLVEDETQIRFLAKSMLEMFGFTVLEAVNGKEALEFYQKSATDIRLVLTDMGMPVMDGYALIPALKQLNPKLPIIISSGFGDADVTSRIGSDNIAGIISKPYRAEALREVLKSVLEQPS